MKKLSKFWKLCLSNNEIYRIFKISDDFLSWRSCFDYLFSSFCSHTKNLNRNIFVSNSIKLKINFKITIQCKEKTLCSLIYYLSWENRFQCLRTFAGIAPDTQENVYFVIKICCLRHRYPGVSQTKKIFYDLTN